jgi:hypothetical protein
MKSLVALLGITILFVFSKDIPAQQWSAEQQEVWQTIDAQWQADKDGKNWVEEFVHPDCVGWSMVAPMPRTKAVTNRWLNAYKSNDKIIEYQIDPLSIVIKNNMAIVHYYYLMLTVNKDSNPEKEKGRWTEIWIKEGNKWLLLGWQGGPDRSQD